MFPVYRVVTRKRGFAGNLCKWSLVGFNGVMVWWLWAALEAVLTGTGRGLSALAGTGLSIPATPALAILTGFWLLGGAILGILTYTTRSRMIVLIEEPGGRAPSALRDMVPGPLPPAPTGA